MNCLWVCVSVCEQHVWVYFDTEGFFFVKVNLWENLEMQEKKTFTMKCFQHILMKYNYDFFVSYIFVDCGWASFLFIIYWKTIEKCKTILLCIVIASKWSVIYAILLVYRPLLFAVIYVYIFIYILYLYIHILYLYIWLHLINIQYCILRNDASWKFS